MKTTITLFVTLLTASANAAAESSSRKRTSAVYKSSSASAVADEKFDPYLGTERKLEVFDWNPVRPLYSGPMSMSMSMSHSMSMSVPEVTEPNSASTVGTAVAACAAAGVVMLL